MIRVCKQVNVTKYHNVYFGSREFKLCNPVLKTEREEMCGEAETFAEAKLDLAAVIHGRCESAKECVEQQAMSATDIGPTFWQSLCALIHRMVLNCNAGSEYTTIP